MPKPGLTLKDFLKTLFPKTMANTGQPTPKLNQRTFKHKCFFCYQRQLVYATSFSNTYEFSCSCGSKFRYDFARKTTQTLYSPPVVAPPPSSFSSNSTRGYQNGFSTALPYSGYDVNAILGALNAGRINANAINANKISYGPKPKTLAEGYDIFEISQQEILFSHDYDFKEMLAEHGILCDKNTRRFEVKTLNLTLDHKVTYLQLPIDYKDENYLDNNLKPMKAVTKNNYVSIYLTWCLKCERAPLKWEILTELFEHCVTNEDYALILDLIMASNLKNAKDITELLLQKLKFRLELFARIPSGNNMLLAYQLIEEYTLKLFEEQKLDVTDEINKAIDKFDKCKSLALNTKYIHERETAFNQSLKLLAKITKTDFFLKT